MNFVVTSSHPISLGTFWSVLLEAVNRQGLYTEQMTQEVTLVTCSLKELGSNVGQDINALN
jgi:hypothetical protein